MPSNDVVISEVLHLRYTLGRVSDYHLLHLSSSLQRQMKHVNIIFPSSNELMDFLSVVDAKHFSLDIICFTIRGQFIEADIELAKAGYGATVIEDRLPLR